jgi:hypothetical protein
MRFGITMTGLALVACGGSALCLGAGAVLPESPDRPVLDPVVSGYATGHPWFWPAVAGVGVSLTLIGLLWLAAQGHAAVSSRFALVGKETRTRVRTATPTLIDEIMAVPGVREARARLTGTTARPRFVVSVVCDETADLAPLRARLEESRPRLSVSLELPELPIVVRLRLVYPQQRLA